MLFISYQTLADWPALLAILPCTLIVALVFAYVGYCEVRYRSLNGIPGPLSARYTNAWRCYQAYKHRDRPTGKSWHQIAHERYGDIIRVGPKTVFTRDPEAIPVVLGFKQRLEKSDSVTPFMVPGVRTSIVGIRDERVHGQYRRPIQGAYSLSSLKAYEPAVDEMIEVLLEVLARHAESRESINIISYDTIMRVTFGDPIGFMQHGKDMYDLIANQVKHVGYVCYATQMPFVDWLLRTNALILYLKPHKASPFGAFAAGKIKEQAEREKQMPEGEEARKTLLSHFLEAKRKYPDIVDDVQIRSYCTSNTLAGSLNPSKVMDLICQWLVQHPDAQDRLYEEIRLADCSVPVPMEVTLRSPFLEGIVRESYRLHKGADIAIERAVDEAGVTLPDGTHLPYGIDVALSTPAMRTLPIYGANTERFDPERWMRASHETEEEWRERRLAMERADLVFGQGSRACLGKSFTHLEVYKAVASIFGQYKLASVGAPRQYDVQAVVQRR